MPLDRVKANELLELVVIDQSPKARALLLDRLEECVIEPRDERPNEYGSTLTGDPAYDAALANWKAACAQWGSVTTWRDEQNFVAAWRRKPPINA